MQSPLVHITRSVLVLFIAKGKYGQFHTTRYPADCPLTTWRTDAKDKSIGQRIMHKRGDRLWQTCHDGNPLAD